MVDKKWLNFGIILTNNIPILRPILRPLKKKLFPTPEPKILFSGWGMTTEHQLPWIDDTYFQKTNDYIKNNFDFEGICNLDSINIDILLWRHWIVCHAVHHALIFTKTTMYNFVECGVAAGLSAFFTLREIRKNNIDNFSMHLYDSWSTMKKEHLLDSESSFTGRYSLLDVNKTKKNLFEFNKHLIYHQGYVPESFSTQPASPESIVYLHIDLNSAKATKSTLEFFYPKLTSGGVILFDDYGWVDYGDTRITTDEFFHDKDGIIFKLPTGQAIFYKH